ncbi:MAG: NADH-quinone oxidoreductase subunit L [Chloroflexi bacterium]|nr:NADH-quinone oxidoreductase subunit L [Chloroflexota bacterium]
MSPDLVWLIFAFPLLSFLSVVFLTRRHPKVCGYVTIGAIALSFLFSLWALGAVSETREALRSGFDWIVIGNAVLRWGVVVDPLTAIMLIVVTSVSLLVQIYSQGYMHGDPGYSRYFAFMSLFTASMLGLVLADNLLMLYIFWELVGLCSYLLIGFWFQKPEAAAAAKKAFIVTRFGDLGLLMAILLLYTHVGSFNFHELEELARVGTLGGTILTLSAIGIFSGAVGKSAQFPLHVWLPDAMEGPTPVSALIHAATMVAAGVYLVARSFPIFEHSTEAMTTVAVIGGITAFIAASMGMVMFDYKRVLAYSTISQLGFMMMGLGVGGYVAGVFHLLNHAFFKAMMFLCAGSVHHAAGTYDIRKMGGLRKSMPITFWAMLIGSLSISGIFPFSGFWSKDEILADALGHGYPVLFWVGLVSAFMTAFYMFRLCFVAFGGTFRGGEAHGSEHTTPHESPWLMTIPLIVLAIPSVLSGFLNANGSLSRFLGEGEFAGVNMGVAGMSMGVAVLGILVAYLAYGAQWLSTERVARIFAPVYTLLVRKYWFDELYQSIIDRILLAFSNLVDSFDRVVVDGAVNGVAWVVVSTGGGLRKVETGKVQSYALVIFLGMLAIAGGFMVFGR